MPRSVSLVGISGSISARERANGFEHPFAVAKRYAQLFQIHLGQSGNHPEVDGLLAKPRRTLPVQALRARQPR